MKNLLIVAVFIGLVSGCGKKGTEESARAEAVESAVAGMNVAKADVVWTAYKITGDQHTGTIAVLNNDLKFEAGVLKSGSVTVNMTTLENTDLEGEWHDKLVGHLKSADFFAVDSFPTSTLVIKEVVEIEGKYAVTGDLTIKGISSPLQFDLAVNTVEGKTVLSSNFNVDRTTYEIKYGSAKFFEGLGDKVIKDEFNLDINIELGN
ncbi:MAG: YceI family protein [Reichenbachiella sp.]